MKSSVIERSQTAIEVDYLNEELTALRGLHEEGSVALDGLHGVTEAVEVRFQTAYELGKMPEDPTDLASELKVFGENLEAILSGRAAYGARAADFMNRIKAFIITKENGTTLRGSLNPDDIDEEDTEHQYAGDKKKLPKLYVVSDQIDGRVVDTLFDPSETHISSTTGKPAGQELGVLVWSKGSPKRQGEPQHLDLLHPSVEFVQHVKKCKLPSPTTHEVPYRFAQD